jgi:hypothetical protein
MAGVEEASMVVVVLVADMSEEASMVVVLVADMPDSEVRRVEAELVRAEAEWASTDPALVVARVTTIAEACVSLIRAPGSFVLQFIDRPPLRERIAG